MTQNVTMNSDQQPQPFSVGPYGETASALRSILFIIVLIVLYLSIIALLSAWQVDRFSVLQRMIGYNSSPGHSYSLQRFREAQQVRDVDVLILGSSHAYRSFDPRQFERLGLSCFNMGSSSQTPINTYYLASRYGKQLNAKLVIYEVFHRIFASEGLESYLDLCTNLPQSSQMIQMAAAVRHPYAIHWLTSTTLSRLTRPLSSFNQAGTAYIRGGYCETIGRTRPREGKPVKVETLKFLDYQFDYTRRVIRFFQQQGATVVLVVQPLPTDYRAGVLNYNEYVNQITTLAEQCDVDFVDFNGLCNVDDYADFYDNHHLNASGVAKFNLVLIDYLRQAGHLGVTN